MTKLLLGIFATSIALTGFAIQAAQPGASTHRLVECEVKPSEEVLLSAEEAGVLVHLAVDDGSMPKSGAVLARIDDRQVKFQMEAARFGHESATARAESEVEIRYAEEAAKVALKEWEIMTHANRLTADSIALIEVERAKLQWNTTLLQIEKAKKDKAIAVLDAGVKKAEVDLAAVALERRTIKAPFDGVVVELLRHQSEWVNPGDPILRFVRLDTMRVEQSILTTDYDPHEIAGCNVTVEVPLARGRTATFTGKITFVSPQLDYAKSYKVRAEVQNRPEAGQWLLRPNGLATMTIHLGTGNSVGVGQRQR
jgi:multidrug efflux pump subunit AcrA (membrane-fusion protein)